MDCNDPVLVRSIIIAAICKGEGASANFLMQGAGHTEDEAELEAG